MSIGDYLQTCLTVFAVCVVPAYGLIVWMLRPTWRRRAGNVERITK